jgi:diadenosine tetraphosphate (Ap4A) HIT family hydrolase
MLDEAKKLLDGRFKPDGYNVGINVDASAGQTVMHCHIHLIPRGSGDSVNPRGSVRGVIAGKADYSRNG